jgi:hypothetical protein
VLEELPGLLVACGVLVAVAAGVLVVVALEHWMRQRASRRGRGARAAQHQPKPAPEPVVKLQSARPAVPPRVQPPLKPVIQDVSLRPAPMVGIELQSPESHTPPVPPAPLGPMVSNADIRRWARAEGLHIADRGPIPARIRQAWADAHPS